MAAISEKLYYRKGGVDYPITLYDSTADVSANYLSLKVSGSLAYADLHASVTSNRASHLRVKTGGVTYAVMKEALAELPSGLIAGFTSDPGAGWTPIGWTLRFPRGAASPGGTGGGGHTHSVTIPAGTLDSFSPPKSNAPSPEGGTNQFDRVDSGPTTHNHTYLSQVVSSSSGSDSPAYYDIVFYKKD